MEYFTGFAVAAAFYICLGKTGHYIIVFISLRKTLNRNDLAAAYPERRNEARVADTAVKNYRTKPAFTGKAACFCAQKPEIKTKYINKPDIRFTVDNDIFSVQNKANGHSAPPFFINSAYQISSDFSGID